VSEILSLEQIVAEAIETALRSVWTTLPARVTGVSDAMVTVQPLPNDIQGGQQVALPSLTLRACFPGGTNGLRWPITEGDIGIAIFSCRPIGALIQSGASAVELQDTRTHSLSDGFYFPVAALADVGTTKPVALQGDDVTLASAWILWFNAIGAAQTPPIPPPSSALIASIIATSTVEAT